MKRFLICKVRADGRREIHDHTDLPSEVLRFEALGYDVVPRSEAARLAIKGHNGGRIQKQGR